MSSLSRTSAGLLPFRDPELAVRKRIDDFLGRLTLDERLAMLHQYAPAVPHLGVAAFRTGSEALHGVGRLGEATSIELRACHHYREPRPAPERGPISLQARAPVLNPRGRRREHGEPSDSHFAPAVSSSPPPEESL